MRFFSSSESTSAISRIGSARRLLFYSNFVNDKTKTLPMVPRSDVRSVGVQTLAVVVPTVPFEQLLDHFADDDILAIARQETQGKTPVRLQIIANERSNQQVLVEHRLSIVRWAFGEPS